MSSCYISSIIWSYRRPLILNWSSDLRDGENYNEKWKWINQFILLNWIQIDASSSLSDWLLLFSSQYEKPRVGFNQNQFETLPETIYDADPLNLWSKNVFNCCKTTSLFVTLWWFPRWESSCTITRPGCVEFDIWPLNKLFVLLFTRPYRQTELHINYIWTIYHTKRIQCICGFEPLILLYKPVFEIAWYFEFNSNTKCRFNF